MLLGDGLDHERRVEQRVEIVGDRYVAGAQAPALLDQALDLRGRGVRAARPEHDLAVLGGDAGEAGGDGASTGDADPF